MGPAASCSSVASRSDTRCFLSTSPHPLIQPFIQELSLYGRYELFLQLGMDPECPGHALRGSFLQDGEWSPFPSFRHRPSRIQLHGHRGCSRWFSLRFDHPNRPYEQPPAPSAQRHERRRQQAPGNSGVSQYPAQQGRPGTALDVSIV